MTTQAVAEVATATPSDAPGAPRRIATLEWVGLAGLLALGGVIRAHGFTSLDLWFDDAWAAIPARVGLSSALHMVLTAPGYGLVLRSWIRLDPTTTWWAQLPAFVLGLLAIPGVWALVRWLRNPRWLAFAAAVVIAVGPLAVQYATRVKEYPFDLLAACALLALGERIRRAPDRGRLVALAVAAVAAFAMSAGVAPVVAGVWLAVVIFLARRRELRGALAGALVLTAVGAVAVWATFLRQLPGVLTTNWRRRGFLVDYRSLARGERSLSLIFGGFVHAALGYPVSVAFFRGAPGLHDVSAAAVGALVVVIAVAVPVVASWRARSVTPELGAALTLAVAIALAFADRVPLGDGRTDEALYPALLVCLAAAARPVAVRVRAAAGDGTAARAVAVAVGLAVLAGSAAYGLGHRALYPTISLRGVAARLDPLVRPGDVVFVDTFNAFGWCYYGLSPCRIQVGGRPPWPQGFRPVSERASVFIPTHYGIPLPELTAAQAHARRIWYVGYTIGTFDVGTDPATWNVPVATYMTGLLRSDGWRPARPSPTTVVFGVHAYAELFVHPGPRGGGRSVGAPRR